ncbi:MAG TPA: hypothetical protein VJ578_05875, partial [Dehalococcoidia bacterium]|nr:hypothetical protein [Dehalococcoidia bacterium]
PQIETVLAALEAHNESPYFGRYLVDPVTDTTAAGELVFLNELLNRLADDIYGDELAGTGVDIPKGSLELTELPGGMSMASSVVQHAIDTAAGSPDGRYVQKYSGDYFNGADWRVVVRDALAATIADLGGIPADPPRPQEEYVHPLSALSEGLVFEPTLLGNRGTWEQIVEAGPVVLGEFIFPLGQSGFVDSAGDPDPNFDSLHSIWGEWRYVPMLHIAEDLATDPDGDVDNDGVLDGFEKWYFGSNGPAPTDDADDDGATLLDEFLNGLDPTAADTDIDGFLDGVELEHACLRPQARDGESDPDGDGLTNYEEVDHGDPCSAGPGALPATPAPGTPVPGTPASGTPTPGTPVAPPPSGRVGLVPGDGGGVAGWWYALAGAAALVVAGGLFFLGKARRRG